MQQAEAQDFIGTWRLLAYTFYHEDGTVEHPWGEDVVGYLLYTPQGYMSANLSHALRRGRLRNALLKASTSNSAVEGGLARLARRSAPRDYISYAGRYELAGETILHHVEVSLFPHWVGLPQHRYYAFDGDTLTLRTATINSGRGRHRVIAELRWQRVL